MNTFRTRRRYVLLPIIAIAFIIPVAQAQTAREVAQKALPSTVLIVAPQVKGKAVYLGSGFFVRAGVIATNYHVIKGSAKLYFKLVGQPDSHPVAKVLATDAKCDLALLQVSGVDAQPLPLGDSNSLEVGEQVYAVGNPEGLEGTISQGIVSAIRDFDGKEYIQITAPVSHGSSGGPVLNESGQVIGIAVGAFKVGQNLNFTIPISDLTHLMAQNNIGGYQHIDSAEVELVPESKAPASDKELSQNSAKAYYDQGQSLIEQKRYAEAIEAFRQAIQLTPDNAQLHFFIGYANHKLGRFQESLEAYKQAIRLRPDDADLYASLGVVYFVTRRFQDALDAYRQAVRLKPDDADFHNSVGNAYYQLARYQEALDAYEQAVQLKPDDADLHCSLGDVYDVLRRYKEAVQSYKQAIRLKPDFTYPHLMLGFSYLKLNDKSYALEEYKILKTLDAEMANKLFERIYR